MAQRARKRVSVTFAGDDDVHQHIESVNTKKRSETIVFYAFAISPHNGWMGDNTEWEATC
jgi:hypothetical protein